MSVIQINHISKRFGRNVALENVSYSVEPGSVFALLGENGAGKTTTIRILLGMCDPDIGDTIVLGLDSQKNDIAIRRKIGYVPEQPNLYDWMTVAEIGKFAAAFYPDGFWFQYGKSVEAYQLPPDTKLRNLSKGMRAKVALALALAHDPELLILDEPTSGLDPLVRREFLESMVDRAATGKTVFLSSHQIAEVERVADYVAIMKKSKLLAVKKLEDLKSETFQLSATFSGIAGDFTPPFSDIIEETVLGRELRVIGTGLNPQAEQLLAGDEKIARFEIRKPSLEEVFVAYMGG